MINLSDMSIHEISIPTPKVKFLSQLTAELTEKMDSISSNFEEIL